MAPCAAFVGKPAPQRVEEHADDALRLLRAAGPGPAHVFATHSGALIGLDPLARHPERVRRLVAHEPPAPDPALPRWTRDMPGRIQANMETSLLYELRQFSAYIPDARALRDAPLVLASGADTRGKPFHRVTVAVGEHPGITPSNSPATPSATSAPTAFASALHPLLTG